MVPGSPDVQYDTFIALLRLRIAGTSMTILNEGHYPNKRGWTTDTRGGMGGPVPRRPALASSLGFSEHQHVPGGDAGPG